MGNTLLTAERLGGFSTCTKGRAGSIVDAEDAYQVLSALDETMDDILDATNLPTIGSPHPDFDGLYLQKLTPRQDVNGQRWVVRAEYGKDPTSNWTPPAGATSIDFRVATWEEEADWTHDAETKWLIQNAANDIMPYTFKKAEKHPIFTVAIHYETEQTYTNHTQYVGTVNDATVSIRGYSLAKWTCALDVQIVDPPGGGMDVIYTIKVRNHYVTWTNKAGVTNTNINVGWHEVLPEMGFYHYDVAAPETRKKVRAMNIIADELGAAKTDPDTGKYILVPSADPVAIAADGTRLPDASTKLGVLVAKYPIETWVLPFY